ncbi:centriolar and ciliogenesis-associated protein HYLS1-like [Halichondria panicea]|uniref:centriolar and ciliogenesis-associated protein HYLS1-like n=1 Tax=Halichondria panicea TaxID=6063 RepID=UPI00312B5812
MATPLVPREYVRQQLKSMGINEISEQELESYTRDFSRLIQEHIDHDSTSSSDLSSLSDAAQPRPLSSCSVSSVEVTPLNTHHPPPPRSALFKTFPGNKENRVQLLSPSNSILLSPVKNISNATSKNIADGRRIVTRKVLRKCNGESRVFDESLSSSAPGSPAKELSRQLSELSLTSVTSSEGSVRGDGSRPHICKSFIRPLLVQPHMKGLKKSDPVARYHEFHKLWEAQRPPGEKSRNRLRWHIREQLLHQDVPYYEPPRRSPKVPEEFMIPADKKRSSLQWEIRH